MVVFQVLLQQLGLMYSIESSFDFFDALCFLFLFLFLFSLNCTFLGSFSLVPGGFKMLLGTVIGVIWLVLIWLVV